MFSVSLPNLSITLPPYWTEYCVITPLGVSGGIHCKVTVVEVTEASLSEHGSLGTKNNISNFGSVDFSTAVSSYVSIHFIINTTVKHKIFNK